MNTTKIIGWLSFVIGFVIISSTIYYTYNVFTGATPIPQVVEIDFNQAQQAPEETSEGIEEQLRQMMAQQIQNLIPLQSLNKFANLFIWSVGAWIIITGGAKISELGIKLIGTPTNKNS